MRPDLRDRLGRPSGQRLKLAVGAADRLLNDLVRQNPLAGSDLADIASETSQTIRQVRAEWAFDIVTSSEAKRRAPSCIEYQPQ